MTTELRIIGAFDRLRGRVVGLQRHPSKQRRAVRRFHTGRADALDAAIDAFVDVGSAPTTTNLGFITSTTASSADLVHTIERVTTALGDDVCDPVTTQLVANCELGLARAGLDTSLHHAEAACAAITEAVVSRRSEPLLLWHVPKCGGTTVNTILETQYYGRVGVLPGYRFAHLLAHLFEHVVDFDLPYLSSNHLAFGTAPGAGTIELLIYRDPVERIDSLFNQYARGIRSGRFQGVLPSYGFALDGRHIRSLDDLLEAMPTSHVNHLTWTLDEGLDPNGALRAVNRRDIVTVPVSGLDEWFRTDGRKLGIDVTPGALPRQNDSGRSRAPTLREDLRGRIAEAATADRIFTDGLARRAG